MHIRFLLMASAMTVTGCAGHRAIIRPSTPGTCMNGDCRHSASHRPSPAVGAVPAEIRQIKGRRGIRTERTEPLLTTEMPKQAFGYSDRSLVASNERPQTDPFDQMRGSIYPEPTLVSDTPARVKIVLDPFVEPPIIDIDEIRMAMRGSVDLY